MFVIYVAEGANMDIVVSSCQCYCVPIRISRHPVPYSNTTTLHIKALRNVDQRHYNMPAGRQKKSAARSRRLQEDLDRDWMTANPYACRFCNQRFPTERGKGGMENHIYSNHSELLEAEAEDWHASYWQ